MKPRMTMDGPRSLLVARGLVPRAYPTRRRDAIVALSCKRPPVSSPSPSAPRYPRDSDRAAPAPAPSRRRLTRQCRAWSGPRPPTRPALRVTRHLSLWRAARESGDIPPQAWSFPRCSPYAVTGTGMIGHRDRPHRLCVCARPGLSLCESSTGRLHDAVLHRRRDRECVADPSAAMAGGRNSFLETVSRHGRWRAAATAMRRILRSMPTQSSVAAELERGASMGVGSRKFYLVRLTRLELPPARFCIGCESL
jgi:hypothetical protein